MKPLNDLLRKEEKFDWNKEQQEAFDKLKRKFQEAPVLQMPDPSKPFVVEMDTSKFASGGILRQQDTNGDWHPCSYISKSFSKTEQNMRFMIKNYWQSSKHLWSGNTICKDPNIQPQFSPTTRTSRISKQRRN